MYYRRPKRTVNLVFFFKHFLPFSLVDPVAEPQGLGRGGALIQEAGVSHLQSSEVTYLLLFSFISLLLLLLLFYYEVTYHSLVVEQGLQPALGYLGLVGRVLCCPPGVLKHVPQDGVGDTGPVITHANVGPPELKSIH